MVHDSPAYSAAEHAVIAFEGDHGMPGGMDGTTPVLPGSPVHSGSPASPDRTVDQIASSARGLAVDSEEDEEDQQESSGKKSMFLQGLKSKTESFTKSGTSIFQRYLFGWERQGDWPRIKPPMCWTMDDAKFCADVLERAILEL